jgi:hypothetical protein
MVAQHNRTRATEKEISLAKGLTQHVDRQGRVHRYRLLNDVWRAAATSVGCIFHGLVGFSAGELSTVEQVLRGMPVRMASGNSHLIIASASIAAAFTHLGVSAVHGTAVPWNILAITIPTVLVGGQLPLWWRAGCPNTGSASCCPAFCCSSARSAFIVLPLHRMCMCRAGLRARAPIMPWLSPLAQPVPSSSFSFLEQ